MQLRALALALLLLGGCVADSRAPQIAAANHPHALPNDADGRYQSFITRYRSARALDTEPELLDQAQRVMARIKDVVIAEYPQARGYAWKVHVPLHPSRVAESFGRGRLVLPTGYFDSVRPSDDEVAAAIGHEIAHDLLGHIDEIEAELKSGRARLNNDAYKRFEIEADILGREIAVKAGYAPDAALSQIRRLKGILDFNENDPIYARYPSFDARIKALQAAP